MISFSTLKKAVFAFLVPALLAVGVFSMPQSSSAQTTDELMAQIQALLAQIAVLQAQLAASGGGGSGVVSCTAPTYNLYLGHSDRETEGQVGTLQKFLAQYPDVYPEALITGYFGPLTEQAVQSFQRKHNIVSSGSPETTGYGVVGPATRAKIRELCGKEPMPIPIPVPPIPVFSIQVLSPNGGETWEVGKTYQIRWGTYRDDILEVQIGLIDNRYSTEGPDGEYTVAYRISNTGSFSFTVPNSLGGLSGGQLGGPYYKVIVYPFGGGRGDLSDAPFSIVAPGSTNLPPTISGVSGPTNLNVGQSGTWTVNARDPEGGTLTYNVVWGDESSNAPAYSYPPPQQTASFTHTYTRQGVFNPTFTVTDSGGLSERTSLSVNVGGATQPSITVLSPNGGEVWRKGTVQEIRWTTPSSLQRVNIGLQKQGTAILPVFTVILETFAGSGSAYWFVPNSFDDAGRYPIEDGNYLLRITGVMPDGSTVLVDDSNAPFMITSSSAGGGWQVNQAPSVPTEKWVVGGSQGVVSNILRFTTTNEDMSLTDLRLQLRDPARASDIARIHLYDGNTLITSKTPSFVNGVEDFTFPTNGTGSFIIPKDSYKEMTVKVDLPGIGSNQMGIAGQFVAVDFDGDGTALGKNTAVGRSSGTTIRTSTQTDIRSNGVRYFRSLPVIQRLSIPQTTLVSGNLVLYKFQVTADSKYDVALRKIAFQSALTGASLSNFVLWDTTDNKRVNAAFSTVATNPLNIKIVADTTDYANPWVTIPAGQMHTFELRADVVSCGASDSVSTRLLGDTQYPVFPPPPVGIAALPMGTVAEVESSPSSNIIWSDFSADTYTTHSLTTRDWANGFKLPGMLSTGLDSSTLSGGGYCAPTSSITVLSPNGGEQWIAGTSNNITWSKSSNVGTVEMHLYKGGNSTIYLASGISGNSYTWNPPLNIVPGNDYKVMISGGAVRDYSDAPFTIVSASDTTPPSIPGNLTATAVSSSQINLSWSVSTDNVGVAGYILDGCIGANCTNFVPISILNALTYNNIGLTANTVYRYRVGAKDTTGNLSGYSNIVSAATQISVDTTPPSIPANFTFTAYNTTGHGMSWSASTDNVGVTGYRLERCAGANCTNFSQIAAPDLATASYVDSGLAAATTYRYRVRAVDGAGNMSGYSAIISRTTDTAPSPSITVISPNGGEVWTAGKTYRISWNSSAVSTVFVDIVRPGYEFHVTSADVANVGYIDFTMPVTLPFNLPPANDYKVTVMQRSNAGIVTQDQSNAPFTITSAQPPPDTAPPSTPTNLSATAQSVSQINLAWTASTDNVGVTGYRVERCIGSTCTNFAQIATLVTNSYSNIGLTAGTAYRWRVRAHDTAGNLSGYSNIVSAVTPASLPDLVVADIGAYPALTTSRSSVISVRVVNQGTASVTGMQIRTTSSGGALNMSSSICGGSTLAPGAECIDSYTFSAVYAPSYSFTATVDPNNFIAESNETNNSLTRIFPMSGGSADTTPPSAPTNLSADVVFVPAISLMWNASTDNVAVTMYKIERCAGASCTNFVQIGTKSLTSADPTASYADSTALNGATYRWRVRATDAAGNNSAYSNIFLGESIVISAAPSTSSIASLLFSIQEQLNQIAAAVQKLQQ